MKKIRKRGKGSRKNYIETSQTSELTKEELDNIFDDKPSRFPRPLGLTYLAKKHQDEATEETKNQYYKYLIQQYALQGFCISNRQLNVYELANYLNLPTEKVFSFLTESTKSLAMFSSSSQVSETMQSILSLSMSWAMQDRGKAEQQFHTLNHSQGNTYKPFISSEVNKSIKLLLESNKNFQDFFKTFFTDTASSLLLQGLHSKKENTNNFISITEAQQLLSKDNNTIRILPKDTTTKLQEHYNIQTPSKQLGEFHELWDKHQIGELVSISARDSEGPISLPNSLEANKLSSLKTVEPLTDSGTEIKETHHEKRRRIQEGTDPEELI